MIIQDCLNCKNHEHTMCIKSVGLSCKSSHALKKNKDYWKPKEEETKMEKPIFESEEQLKNFIEKHIFFTNDNTIAFVSTIESVRNAGLIKKSSLEIAREVSNDLFKKCFSRFYTNTEIKLTYNEISTFQNTVLELEKEITRLSGKQ